MRKFFILSTSQGCVSNYNEEALYTDYLTKVGFNRTDNETEADVVIVNSCSHLPSTKTQSEFFIAKFKQCKSLIVTGCYPLMHKGEFSKMNIHHFKPGDLKSLAEIVEVDFKEIETEDNYISINSTQLFDPYQKLLFRIRPFLSHYFKFIFKRSTYWKNFINTVTISSDFFIIRTGIGCLGNCTFCGIKRSKGRIKSKTLGAILSELENATKRNSQLVCLSGEDIGCWGQDINTNSAFLLENIIKNSSSNEIVIEYFDPEWLVKYEQQLVPLFSSKKITCVTFALQCGSSKIIDLMNRKYNPNEVIKIIQKIKKLNPNLIIKSNTIAGFPQETWLDFWKTITSLFYFDGTSVDAYGLVSGTEASVMSGQISPFIKNVRASILHGINLLIIGNNLFINLLFPKR
jgi:tRNA A37 methylthiotransferase MiaB